MLISLVLLFGLNEYLVQTTASVPNGSHTLLALARDAAGNTATAAPVTVSIVNVTLPPNKTSDSQVEYGLTTSYGNQTILDTNLITSYTRALIGLSANTIYNYRVKSKDAAGNLSLSQNVTFTTAAPKPLPPSPTGCSSTTSSSAVLTEPTTAKPGLLVQYTDPKLGGCIRRVTDRATIGADESVPIYSQLQAWNADRSRLLIVGGKILDAITYQLVHTIDFGWPATGEDIRWSPTNPNVLYYTGGLGAGGADPDGIACGLNQARLMRYRLIPGSPLTAKRELVRCFSEYTSFEKDPSYEELSDDGRYVALLGIRASGTKEVVTYDVIANTKGSVLTIPSTAGVDWTAMSPSGKYVLVQFTNGINRYQGMEAFDRPTMAYAGKVSLTTGHGDLVMDASGNEYLVQTNASNAFMMGDRHYIIRAKIPNGVVFAANGSPDETATIASGATVQLLTLDWFLGMHISCRNTKAPGWCVVSTTETGPPTRQPFQGEVLKLYLDSTFAVPHVERLAHHRSDTTHVGANCAMSSYWAQPHVTVRKDGGQIAFGSTWGKNCFAETYVINVTNLSPLPPVPSPSPTPIPPSPASAGSGPPASPLASPSPPKTFVGSLGGRTLSLGSHGQDVTTLQTFLIQKGYLTGTTPTGYYGILTRTAVQKYQCAKGIICSGDKSLTGYGMTGQKTRAAIMTDAQGMQITTPAPSLTPSPSPSKTPSGSLGGQAPASPPVRPAPPQAPLPVRPPSMLLERIDSFLNIFRLGR